MANRRPARQQNCTLGRAAQAVGGIDNGAPGPCDYHPGNYAALVYDPEGNNIKAVIHDYAE
ncbi:hypothetical protein [Gordonibacter urolithinfaciens]|uniref:hypothetical protein n=1 Tax=Gordonibacter urolithinfaciens TaxID=1335613 RepID=UPI003AAF7ABA